MENYFMFEMIGEGSFGKVYKGQRKSTNQIVAIKKIAKRGKKEKELKNLRQEIEILRKLYHENIIQLLDSFESSNDFYLVTELAQGQLFEILEEDKNLPESEVRKIAQQLVSALYYLHSNNIIHRDIKPQNILISSSGVIKLCDFGFARAIDSKTMVTSIKGTPLYMAPELLQEYPYNHEADLWSLGVILYELFVGQPPFYTNNFGTLMNKIIKENVKYPENMGGLFKEFLKGLLIKNPRERHDWPRILESVFLRENDNEKQNRVVRQDNYKKWILRLKSERIFSLYDCDKFLAKFSSTNDIDNGTKGFAEFESQGGINDKNVSNKDKIIMKKTSNSYLNEEFWNDSENKANTEDGATNLRKNTDFSEQLNSVFKYLLVDDKIIDKKLLNQVVKILVLMLMKGKFDSQHPNLDITRNQNILNSSLLIFKISLSDEYQNLLNDIIKVIGLFAKFSVYFSNGIDVEFCSGFLKYIPNLLIQNAKPSNIQINLVKAIGIMITAASMMTRRSLVFYRTLLDLGIITILFTIIKNYKANHHMLVRSCCECLCILIHPTNCPPEIFNFPMIKFGIPENFSDFKTFFSYLDTLKRLFLKNFLDINLLETFSIVFEIETDNVLTLKCSLLRILLQLIRFAPKETIPYFLSNSLNIAMMNSIFTIEDQEQKILIQLGLMIMTDVTKFFNTTKKNINDIGIDISKMTNYVNRLLSTDFVTFSVTVGLVAELLSSSYLSTQLQMTFLSPKLYKNIRELIKNLQGKGKEENKKLEGSNFGFQKFGIIDYPLFYLEKITKIFLKESKNKVEYINSLNEIFFDDIFVDLLSNSAYKNDISPRGFCSLLNIVYDLIINDYKTLFKKVAKDTVMKSLITFFKDQQNSIILEWPTYTKEESVYIGQTLSITSLKITKFLIEFNAITENIAKGELLPNLKSTFTFIGRDNFILPISIILNLLNERNPNDDIINKIATEYFSKSANLMFIKSNNILKEFSNKDLIVETLLLLSSLCRKSQDVYPTINDLNVYSDIKYMLENLDSGVKSRVCNLIGNMCRYSDYFYEELIKNNLVTPIIQCCYDQDKNTRKFACFAIGNAAFINDRLYESFRICIPILVDLLVDSEDNTRANSAGALGNFVRCSDLLCQDIILHKAHIAILNLAEKEESIQTIKVALFALGNFCNHNIIKNELEKLNFKSKIDQLKTKYKNESQLSELFERIKKKLQ